MDDPEAHPVAEKAMNLTIPDSDREQPARLPPEFTTAIESSRSLLALGPDWDDAGATPIDSSTWRWATELLRRTVMKIGEGVPVPRISPCNNGSIDLFWKTAKFTLLINVKPSETKSDFYGETTDGLMLEGTFSHRECGSPSALAQDDVP